ncbi:MAG TPA: SPOR domain-containing protein [Bacteroidales bacterium]|nr:SPOR domain-containing protein [Bacteroidales bacterium]
MIGPAISELLRGHECVIVPGLGGFLTSHASACIDETTGQFMPPRKSVAFNASLSNNDGILAYHLACKNNISYTEALTRVKDWSYSILQSLRRGNAVEIGHVGKLSLNTAGNIHFEPDAEANYLDESYGLPFFTKPALNMPVQVIQESASARKVKESIRNIVPSTLKWAAVLAPLIGFFIWGSVNTPSIGNFVNNQSGIFAWSNTTPGKTSVITGNQAARPPVTADITSPAEILGPEACLISPASIPYEAMHSRGLTITEPCTDADTKSNAEKPSYFIVGGAFREVKNAGRLVKALQQQGYPATIADTTHKGLYVVSIRSFSDREEAFRQLKTIRESGHPSAWVLKAKN